MRLVTLPGPHRKAEHPHTHVHMRPSGLSYPEAMHALQYFFGFVGVLLNPLYPPKDSNYNVSTSANTHFRTQPQYPFAWISACEISSLQRYEITTSLYRVLPAQKALVWCEIFLLFFTNEIVNTQEMRQWSTVVCTGIYSIFPKRKYAKHLRKDYAISSGQLLSI